MKKLIQPILAVVLLFLPLSCNKDVATQENLYAFTPSNVDANAGTWKPVYMTSNSQIVVPAPVAVTDPTYVTELATVKQYQNLLNDDRRNAINYWSGGGVLRWNQIFRELVARFNLPPAPLADNTYPAPDVNNPFADPQFPFANPPYAARAYSYVSAAMYDALKAAWYYKYQFNRQAPYQVDNTIKPLMPQVNIPAYPSEEAVMSGVAQTILSAMFPVAVDEITLKAGEQRNVAMWSGKAAPSDVTAGFNLGKSIATAFLTRASGDGMGSAIGTPAIWKALQDTAIKHGQIPWLSLDQPSRPPMLPLFSKVKGWMMSPTDIVNARPGPPPSTNSSEMTDQVKEVKYYADNLTRDRLAIVHKWADGAGTYTPPGHWNDIAEEYIRDAKYSEVRAARAFALLNMTMHDAAVACWDTKYYYFNPRPTQMDPSIKTGTGIPNFPSYVSGHSTFSASAATVLSYLFPDSQNYFQSQATEASLSRLYGAIHYRIDVDAGVELGNRVGTFTVTFAQGDGAN
jgi:hypothetical protein